jgi:hypothetical protein
VFLQFTAQWQLTADQSYLSPLPLIYIAYLIGIFFVSVAATTNFLRIMGLRSSKVIAILREAERLLQKGDVSRGAKVLETLPPTCPESGLRNVQHLSEPSGDSMPIPQSVDAEFSYAVKRMKMTPAFLMRLFWLTILVLILLLALDPYHIYGTIYVLNTVSVQDLADPFRRMLVLLYPGLCILVLLFLLSGYQLARLGRREAEWCLFCSRTRTSQLASSKTCGPRTEKPNQSP